LSASQYNNTGVIIGSRLIFWQTRPFHNIDARMFQI
jgi:hypothetical protein